jgi:hypothetical protein
VQIDHHRGPVVSGRSVNHQSRLGEREGALVQLQGKHLCWPFSPYIVQCPHKFVPFIRAVRVCPAKRVVQFAERVVRRAERVLAERVLAERFLTERVVRLVGGMRGMSEKAGRVRGRWFRLGRVKMRGRGRGTEGTMNEKGGTTTSGGRVARGA